MLFVDVETTGLHSRDHIVSYGGILADMAGIETGTMNLNIEHLIFDPGVKSHPEAEKVHGYSDWLLRHQDQFPAHAAEVAEQIAKADLVVAHNADFDIRFLRGSCKIPPDSRRSSSHHCAHWA